MGLLLLSVDKVRFYSFSDVDGDITNEKKSVGSESDTTSEFFHKSPLTSLLLFGDFTLYTGEES